MPNSTIVETFSHLLVEADSEIDPRLDHYKKSHTIQEIIRGYSGIEYYNGLSTGMFQKLPMIKIRQTPKIFILKKKI